MTEYRLQYHYPQGWDYSLQYPQTFKTAVEARNFLSSLRPSHKTRPYRFVGSDNSVAYPEGARDSDAGGYRIQYESANGWVLSTRHGWREFASAQAAASHVRLHVAERNHGSYRVVWQPHSTVVLPCIGELLSRVHLVLTRSGDGWEVWTGDGTLIGPVSEEIAGKLREEAKNSGN